jgi:hypothetical protein
MKVLYQKLQECVDLYCYVFQQAKLSHSCRVSPQNSFITHEHSLQQCARNFSTPLAVDIRRGSFGELSQCLDKWFSSAMDSLLSQKERCLAQLQQSHKLSLRTSAMALEEFQRLNVDNIETTLSQVKSSLIVLTLR